ncbi:Fe-S cluster assembly protein SufD [Paenarthrobacter ilicis]|uniref:Fe-S cluster assembly protein SufD n=1 Tax=Paenarthrobacter ilicis TaxID=43665 RepID=A0ABX0THL9_9MICC|nr:Fe-S cluster assembly protein SufD [Paenarthrobacter ilicis]MBM7793232.1 Fe-S cluster assembly protein SufD [Paenarthrobacter ilicis]NIJ01992.1 Fe-S cluster assembly protein SufD [Paenarthrobacter ilicis]
MTDITTEKARIGAPSAQPFIDGFTEEGENLSPINAKGSTAAQPSAGPLAGASAKSHSHGGGVGVPDSSRAGRLTSFNLEDFTALTGLEEDWRFTPLRRLRGLHSEALTGAAPTVSVTAPAGVTVETVGRDDQRIGQAGIPEDRVSANAWANFKEATVITVPSETPLDSEITVTLAGSGSEASAQHVVIVARKFSKGLVVLGHEGTAVVSENVEIILEDGAELTVVSLQEWNDDSVHASSQQAKIGRDAKFKHIVVSLGGDLVRVTPTARFAAPGGEVELFGLYFADAGQHLEHRTFVDHGQPNCVSNVLYKGALQGKGAHTVWVGDVLIQKNAEGTDSYEKNQNLVLSDGCRADSVPNLEIETGLIAGAGHASATGRFDDEHLFYLMARGIPEDVARRLVVRGFLNEIIQKINVPAIEDRLTEAVEREFSETDN